VSAQNMKKENKISIITLTYNKLEKATKPFINYLFRGYNNFELIIIDNGSTDGTVEFLKELERKYDNVKVVYNSENLGFSKGCNKGIKLATGDIIGLLNNDILFSSDWIKYVIEVLEKEANAGFVSLSSIESFCNSKRKFDKIIKKLPDRPLYELCLKPSFSCVFTKKYIFDKIGLFDENFTPAYFEDDDIAWRAIFAGFKNFKLSNVYFYHLGSVTGKSLPNLHEIFLKNKQYFFEKYADKPYVEAYWKCVSEHDVLKNKILEYRLLLRVLGLKNLVRSL